MSLRSINEDLAIIEDWERRKAPVLKHGDLLKVRDQFFQLVMAGNGPEARPLKRIPLNAEIREVSTYSYVRIGKITAQVRMFGVGDVAFVQWREEE